MTDEVGTIKVVAGFVWWNGSHPFGDKTFYSFKFDGEDQFYRQGTERYEGILDKGKYVKVEVELKANGHWEVRRAKAAEAPEEAVEQQEKSAKKKSGAKKGEYARKAAAKNDYWEQKDIYYKEVEVPALRYNAARTAALVWIPILLANGALKLAAKTKVEENRVILDGLLDFYTAKFADDATEQKAVARVAEALEPKEDPYEVPAENKPAGSEFDDD